MRCDILRIVTVFVIGVAAVESCLGQSRTSGVILSIGVPDGAHTYDGDVLRGRGALYQGQGALLRGLGANQIGAGQYLESLGRYQYANQQVQLLAEDLKQKRLETQHQKRTSEFARRQQKAEANEVSRLQQQRQQLVSLRDQPTSSLIQSGGAVNFLWDQLGAHVQSVDWRKAPLPAEQLAQVKLQTATGLSLAKLTAQFDDQDGVAWPEVLRDYDHFPVRRDIDNRVRQLLDLVRTGRTVDPADVSALRQRLAKLLEQARRRHNQARNITAAIEVGKFMNGLSDTVKQLGQPAARQLFDGTLDFQPANTQQLIEHLIRHNLRFAPTAPTGVAAYTKLHATLAATHRQLVTPEVATR